MTSPTMDSEVGTSGDVRTIPSDVSCMPSTNAGYLKMQYWDERFKKEEEYEWFKGYSAFRHLIQEHVNPSARVLVLGCGNSRLSESLYRDGCTNITSTDLSPIVISRMRERCSGNGCEGILWEEADMLNLPYQDNSWDCVIEKGAMDVLFVDQQSPWEPSDDVTKRVSAMLTEAHRVLTPHGLFISITFGQPHFRRPFFEAEGLGWEMRFQTFGEGFHYYFYTLYKVRLTLKEHVASLAATHHHKTDTGMDLMKMSRRVQVKEWILRNSERIQIVSTLGTRVPSAFKRTEAAIASFDMEHEYMDDENYLTHLQDVTED